MPCCCMNSFASLSADFTTPHFRADLPGEEYIEIITIGPYIQRCYGAHGERDCLMEYNEDSGQWEFFYEGIQGFDFEPGFIYTLEVRLEDRGPDIQDVGQYAYHLVKIIEKKKAPADFSYGW